MEFNLGKRRFAGIFTRKVKIPHPAIVQMAGIAGSGRGSALIELARQSIDAGMGVVYIDCQGNLDTFSDLLAVARSSGKENNLIQKAGQDQLSDADLQEFAEKQKIVFYGSPFLEKETEERLAIGTNLFGELSTLLQVFLEHPNKPFTVILDSVFSGMREHARGIADFIRTISLMKLNVSIVFSDHNVMHHGDASIYATARVFFQSYDKKLWLDFPGVNFVTLSPGECFVMHGMQEGGTKVSEVRFPYPLIRRKYRHSDVQADL